MDRIRRAVPMFRWLMVGFNALAGAFAVYTLNGARGLNPRVDFKAFADGEGGHLGTYIYFVAFSPLCAPRNIPRQKAGH